MIFRYTFEDGTVLKLVDNGFSAEEIWKLEELHGKLIFFTESEEQNDDL